MIEPSRYEAVRDEIKEGLEALGDEDGAPIETRVHRPEDLYAEVNGIPPDLLVYFGDLHWRSAGTVGTSLHLRENDTGPDDANHAHEGLYILAGPGVQHALGEEQRIVDIAPTVLRLLGEPVPVEMGGEALSANGNRPGGYSEDEEALVAQRLEDLGYL